MQCNGPHRPHYEASTSYGVFYDELSKIAERVVVAHPAKLALIGHAMRKNDHLISRHLTQFLPRASDTVESGG